MALNQSQYNAILRIYDQRQLNTRRELEKRRKDLLSQFPRIKEIEDTISTLSLQQARRLLDGDDNALLSLKREINALIEEKGKIISEGGYPSDYLEPVYECADCKDTGYINNEKCHCFKRAEIDMLYTQSNLQAVLDDENFDTFSFGYYSSNYVDSTTGRSSLDNIKEVYRECRDFVDTFSSSFRNLLLYGNPGIGKTFLSHCIAKELIDKSYSVIYFTAFELFDIMAKSRFDKNPVAETMYEHIFNCDLLIIDDLGAETSNPFTVSQLFHCINERLLRRKSTIISTNLSFDSLKETYTERTFSRIMSNYKMLKLTGDDIRIKKRLMH